MNTFAKLFKKYRLRAEFETISSFSDALAEKGYFYEESIFSHWQKGTRVPNNRDLLLNLIKIFIERDAIRNVNEANALLESAQQGYLTEKELSSLHFPTQLKTDIPFQVPCEIADFTGREKIVDSISKDIKKNNVFLLYGPPGVGKTALAIRLGHQLKNTFTDGVLWYKVDSSNIMDILLSIAQLFGEDISEIKDVEVRASIVRTLLVKKKLLLIFDNVSKKDQLQLLLPNSPSCCVIFTSREYVFNNSIKAVPIPIQSFTNEETLLLFNKVFYKEYVDRQKKVIFTLAEKLGYLPLALHLVAKHSKQFKQPLEKYSKQLDEEIFDLEFLTYEDKNLFKAINISFNSLENIKKDVFISLGIFEGKDFSIEAISYINKLPKNETEKILQELLNISFIEISKAGRYRIHPMIRTFARQQIEDQALYLRAAGYFEQRLISAQDKLSQKHIMQDVDNIIYIFKKCYDLGYWDQIITLWNPLEKFLSDTNEVKKLKQLAQNIDTAPNINSIQKILSSYSLSLFLFWIILFINIKEASLWGAFYSMLMGLIPFIGGLLGILRSKTWGLFSSTIGKAIFFISLGLFSWGCGNTVWAYYNFFQDTDIPYPSFADVGFAPAYVLWIVGVIYLSKATGAKFEIKMKLKQMLLLIIPLVVIYFSYYFLFFIVERSYASETPLRIFFDLYYPSMNVFILSFAIIIFGLSINFFGGKYKLSLFSILLGFTFLYGGDFTFSYATSTGIFYTGGPTDIIYTVAFYLISWGTLSFYLTPKKLQISD